MKLMKIKYMVVGIVIGAFAATAISAGASTLYERFTALARPDYTLVVDGKQVALKTPPKTIEGATHLPLRELADVLGKDVNFNGKSGTITLTTKIESERDSVSEKMFVDGRQLVELLGAKYPELAPNQITLNQKGLLILGENTYNLEVNDNKRYEVSELIRDGILTESDIQ